MSTNKPTCDSHELSASAIRKAFVRWQGDDQDLVIARAPGRVNLIGEHTDYNDGLVMPMILDRSIYVACRAAQGTLHRVRSEDFDETVSFELNTMPTADAGHWSLYVGGMLRHVPPGTALDILIAGNVPLGAGLSSSAALEMATGLAAEAISGVAVSPERLAEIGQRVEHEYLGVRCGLMDQMVSRMGRSEHAFLLDCRQMTWSHIPIPASQARFVIVDSKVKRALAASKYNERRQECERALAWFQASGAMADSLRDISVDMINEAANDMAPTEGLRVRHVVEENKRVRAAAEAIRKGKWSTLGRQLTASHRSLQQLYQVSCDELDTLVDIALNIDGVYGARMVGGGFGGCTLNLVDKSALKQFETEITSTFHKAYGYQCSVIRVGSGLEATLL